MTRATIAGSAIVYVLLTPAIAHADATDRCIASAASAQHLRLDAQLRAARKELLACAREVCPAAIARDCKRWLAEVDASLPTVVVRVVDAYGRDVTDALVVVDGEAAPVRADGRALPLDPGEHTLAADHEGVTARASIVVAEGEHDRLVTLTMPAPLATREATPPLLATTPPRASVPLVTWVLGGAGVVAATAGVFFWVSGRSDRSTLFETCGVSRTCTADDKDRAQTKLVIGDVLVAGGVGALAAAVIIGVTTVRVSASPTASGGVVVGYGAF